MIEKVDRYIDCGFLTMSFLHRALLKQNSEEIPNIRLSHKAEEIFAKQFSLVILKMRRNKPMKIIFDIGKKAPKIKN